MNEHARRLLEGLIQPQAWRFTGEVIDAGPGAAQDPAGPKCVCGHPIRYMYEIEAKKDIPQFKTGSLKYIGSVCVKHIAYIAPELAAAIAEAERQRRDDEKRRKEQEQNAIVSELKERYEGAITELREKYRSYTRRGERAPYSLWQAVASSYRLPLRPSKRYKSIGALIKWYEKGLETLKMETDRE